MHPLTHPLAVFLAALGVLACDAGSAPKKPKAEAAAQTAEPIPRKESNVSLRNEVQLAIDKGLAWLAKQQQADGSFSNPEHPSLTALPTLAFLREPSGKYSGAAKPEFIEKAIAFVRSKAKPDGSIFEKGLSNYNTSICLTTLLAGGIL